MREPSLEHNFVNIRLGALAALLFAAAITAVATAGVAAMTIVGDPPSLAPVFDGWSARAEAGTLSVPDPERGEVLAGTPSPSPSAPVATSTVASQPTEPPAQPATEVTGIGSNYAGTAGWMGEATVALPGDLGGRYTGVVNGHVTVCADRCVRLPVVDWCQCYWGTSDERVVDLSHSAWALVSDAPLAEGLIKVRLVLEG